MYFFVYASGKKFTTDSTVSKLLYTGRCNEHLSNTT